jgi:DNA-binding SARP family transcriptional activator/ATP/maltotriose-dependent transcriptional regulator MalT
MLVRPRLLSALRSRFERRVTVVLAGPGFGKTTLLAQSVAENALDPLGIDHWVTCESDDAAASILAGAISAALGEPPPDGAEPRALAASLAAAVAKRAPVALALVLDDVHEIPPESAGAELLAELVARLPTNAHLVLGARHSPPIPLARLVARGEALRLEEPDLAFTDDELHDFASLRGVDAADLAGVGQWPALAELVAAGPHMVHEFLWEETLARLPAARRHALAVLAALGPSTAQTLEAALGEPIDVDQLVDDLPLAGRGTDGSVFLHALWSEPLSAELDDAERNEALLRAGRHLRTHGDHLRAFRLFAAANEWHDALAVAVDACDMRMHTSVDLMTRWHDQLPEHLRSEPGARLLVGLVAKQRGEPAVDELQAATSAFRERGEWRGEVVSLVHLAEIGSWTADASLVAIAVERALELEADGVSEATTMATLGRALLHTTIGNPQDALDTVAMIPVSELVGPWKTFAAFAACEAQLILGRADDALNVIRDADFHLSIAADPLPCALWYVGEINEARAAATEGLEIHERVGVVRLFQAAGTQAARFDAFVGDVHGAEARLAQCEALGPPAGVYVEARLALAQAAIAVVRGDEAAAHAVLARMMNDHPVAADAFWRAHRRALTLTYVLLPETRDYWDADDLGPSYRPGRDLARALVEVREHGDAAAFRDVELPSPGKIRAALPLPWATLAAVAIAITDQRAALDLLDALGRDARRWLDDATASPVKAIAASARHLLAESPAEPSDRLELGLIGPTELRRDDEVVAGGEWRRERVRQLLAYLVVHRSATREAIADALWSDLDSDAGANNLRVTLSYLLRVLEPDRKDKEASFFIRQDKSTISLTGQSHLAVDLWTFDDELSGAADDERAGAPSLALEHYRAAAAIWRGPFLSDADAIWAENEAERVRVRFLQAATRAGELALASGGVDESEALALRVLAVEPWSERAYRLLVATHLARGDRPAARRALERCHAMLDELGVEPEPETRMLQRRVDDGPAESR